jgi:hypothetical protein
MGLLPRMSDSQRLLEIMSNFADYTAAEDQRADDENRDWITVTHSRRRREKN